MTHGTECRYAGHVVTIRSAPDSDGRVLVEYEDGTYAKARVDRLFPLTVEKDENPKLATLSELGSRFLRGASKRKIVLR
jgi:hypothetical protein